MHQNNVLHLGFIGIITAITGLIIGFSENIISSTVISAIALALSLYISIMQIWEKPPEILFQDVFFKKSLGSTPTQYTVFGSIINTGERITNVQITDVRAIEDGKSIAEYVTIRHPNINWFVLNAGSIILLEFLLNKVTNSDFSIEIKYKYSDKTKIKEGSKIVKNIITGTLTRAFVSNEVPI